MADDLDDIADVAPLPVWAVDARGRRTFANRACIAFTGLSAAETLAADWRDIVHPDDADRVMRALDAIDGDVAVEGRFRRGDGAWRRLRLVHRPRHDAAGRPAGFVGVAHDLSDDTGSDRDAGLRRTAETVRLAIEGAGMATWELDLAVMSGEWSPNRFDLLGLPRTPDGRSGFDDWLACVHPDDRRMAEAAARRCFADGTPFEIEYRILRADTGEERWLTSHGSRIAQDDGRPPRFVGVSFDITERHRTEQAVRASEARFREIFEQANDYIFTSDLDQRITSGNPAAIAALGLPFDQIAGRSFADFLRPDQFAQTSAMLAHKLAHGGTTRHKVAVAAADGREMAWEVNSRLILDANGRPTGLHAIGRDVTEAERAQAHQRLLINELNHRVKNTLAIVQSIARQSFGRDVDPVIARDKFEARLAALAEAHDLLTRENWHSASIATVAAEALAAHDDTGRILMDGPDVRVGPKTAISLALALHELATNALKHGALSRPDGRVRFAWTREGEEIEMRWIEENGPSVTPPERRGFGTRMIERGLAAEFGGAVTLDFARDGLRCTIRAPLPA